MPKTKKKPAKKPTTRRIDLKPKAKRNESARVDRVLARSRATAVGIAAPSSRAFARNEVEGSPAFDGRQALIAGVRPFASDAQPDDHEPTVMTIRTTKGEVRAWVAAAKRAGQTFPMPWARQVLKIAAAAAVLS